MLVKRIIISNAFKISNANYGNKALEKEEKHSKCLHCVLFSVFDDIVIHPNRYVKNEVSNRSFQRKLELRDFFQNPVRGAWKDFSTMANIANVNAYYNQATNTMVVPIGMLQPPLFWSRPKSLTFGAFGIVVGKWVLFLHRFIASPFSKKQNFFSKLPS